MYSTRWGMTDSGDMGFIEEKPDGFEAFGRGDNPNSIGVFDTVEAAAAALASSF
ncbi:hypothetical protein [Frondihabitans cladoniiphilus]|uniref:hypothetical protein n=1 Tax=Frondihabitans cladoniiphilus TaxID=715785 RepID=UPI0031E55157